MTVDYATCDECGESVDKDSAVTWTRRLSPLKVAYRHPECYDPWAEEGPPIPEWHKVKPEADAVNSPGHYTWLNGIEVIEITEHFNFLLGNVLKYVMRADHKGRPIEDLEKAAWYLSREIANRKSSGVL
jgi:hypothetical protein